MRAKEKTKMDYINEEVILIYAVACFLWWGACTTGVKKVIPSIGINKKYYPQGYIMPGQRMQKFFKLKKQEIPRWCYRTLLLSFVYIAYFIAMSLEYLCVDDKLLIMDLFEYGYIAITALYAVQFFIFWNLYKK